MSSFHVPANQSVSWTVYNQTIANGTGLPHEFLRKESARIAKAFDRGEPIWITVLELKMVYEVTKDYKPTKTPLALAKRVVRL